MDKLERNFGDKQLDSLKSTMIPFFDSSITLKFKSANGNIIEVLRSKTIKKFDTIKVNQWISYEEPCRYKINHFDRGVIEVEQLYYTSNSNVFPKADLGRYWNGVYKTDSLGFLNAKEVFTIYGVGKLFVPQLEVYTEIESQRFYPKIIANGKERDSVYEFFVLSLDSTFIVPHGFYYTKKEGIIGFYITQKIQEWWLE